MATESDSKKLSDLRIVHLRAELEKRGLEKTGVKVNLIKRLQQALVQEGKDPEEYEFDLSNKKLSKRLSPTAHLEENDANADQPVSDSSILMIETPSLDTGLDALQAKNEKETYIQVENANAESPLNLSICEEEENLLFNFGDEQRAEDPKVKFEDVQTASSNYGVSYANANELKNTTKEQEDNKDEDNGTNVDTDAEEEQVNNREQIVAEDCRSNCSKITVINTNEVSTTGATAAPVSSTSAAVQSEKDFLTIEQDKNMKTNSDRSLWITNLLPSTRAQKLKHLLSRYGKVIGAKVVQSSRYPSQRCYGYVTMETCAAADLCIEKLNHTELKGQVIRVAKVRPEHSIPMKAQEQFESKEKDKKKQDSPENNDSDKSLEKKKVPSLIYKKKDESKKESKEEERDSRNTNQSGNAKKNRNLPKSLPPRTTPRKFEILSFQKIREDYERQNQRERERERERAIRDEEKRRRENQRAREIEKRQREEAMRLEREREKLRIERERLDRQRVEIIRLERVRQQLEREKLEQEKQELRRQQMRLEEARRPVKRPSCTTTEAFRRKTGSYTDDRKRIASERHYDETPPPPHFEVSTRAPTPEIANKKEIPKDYKSRIAYPKRSDFKREYSPAGGHPSHIVRTINNTTSSPKYDLPTYVNRDRERDIREPSRREAIIPSIPPPRISKAGRYAERSGERSPVSYRPVRDERERKQVVDHHLKSEICSRDHRYTDAAMKEGAAYRESTSWLPSGTPAVKPFSGISRSTSSSRESWTKADNWRPMETTSNERWGNSLSRVIMSSSSGVANAVYSAGNANMSSIGPGGLACPAPLDNNSYLLDRFENNYKSINSMRKY